MHFISSVLLITFIILGFTACSDSGGGGQAAPGYTYSCINSSKSFSGCCSGHGGPFTDCGAPSTYKFRSDGALVCTDNTISPSCKL